MIEVVFNITKNYHQNKKIVPITGTKNKNKKRWWILFKKEPKWG